jgi:hypothetical protein
MAAQEVQAEETLRDHGTRHYDGSASRRASKPACTKWRSLVRAL